MNSLRTIIAAAIERTTRVFPRDAREAADAILASLAGAGFVIVSQPREQGPAESAPITTSRLTPEDIREIRRLAAAGAQKTTLARLYGVNPQTIGDIVIRLTWKHVADDEGAAQ